MSFSERILNEQNQVVPEWVKQLRRDKGLSQQELADRAGLNRSAISKIENEPAKKRHADTVKRLHDALDIPLPGKKQVEAFGPPLVGRWISYHWTRKKDPKTLVLMKSEWEIEPSGACVMMEEPGLRYTGVIEFESEQRLIASLKSESASFSERLFCRFPCPLSTEQTELKGAWFGMDYRWQTLATPVVLVRKLIGPTRARQLLEEIDDFVARPSAATGVTVRPKWSKDLIEETIGGCQEGDTIDMLSVYFPEILGLRESIKELAKIKLEEPRNRIRIRILLLDYRAKELIAARFKYRKSEHFDGGKEIKRQGDQLIELTHDDEFSAVVDLKVKYFRSWLPAHYFQIGQTSFFGLLTASRSAILGSQYIIEGPDSAMWEQLNDDFEVIWKDAEPAVSG